MLAGTIGDALGAPVEFMSRSEIVQQFGPRGITRYVPAYGVVGAITDDTQMTLFTAEGLLRADVRFSLRGVCNPVSVVRNAYLRWLRTQGTGEIQLDGWLASNKELFARRAPGLTCLASLRDAQQSCEAINDSKGAGGIMRIAPVAVMAAVGADRSNPASAKYAADAAFQMGCKVAGITHGHPTGQLAAGAMASIVAQVLLDVPIREAAQHALALVAAQPNHRETVRACESALDAVDHADAHSNVGVAQLGEGWVAEEALAIALYCALAARDFESAIIMAVNHDGDSDTTGSLVGHLLGATLGTAALPSYWLEQLELRDVIQTIADDMVASSGWNLDDPAQREAAWGRYPGW